MGYVLQLCTKLQYKYYQEVMKIKVTIKKGSAAAKVVHAMKAEKDAFKAVVSTGKAAHSPVRSKPSKVATV